MSRTRRTATPFRNGNHRDVTYRPLLRLQVAYLDAVNDAGFTPRPRDARRPVNPHDDYVIAASLEKFSTF